MVGRPEILFPLFSELTTLDGVGPKISNRLLGLDITCPKDLLMHIPLAICNRSLVKSVLDLELPRISTIIVQINKHLPNYKKGQPYKIEVFDGKGVMFNIVYFHPRSEWLKKMFPVGESIAISGKFESFDNIIQITHPDYIVKPTDVLEIPNVEPIYALTSGVSQKLMFKAIKSAINLMPNLLEWIGSDLIKRENWLSWHESLRKVHSPTDQLSLDPLSKERQRLAYDELFAHQLTLAIARSRRQMLPGLKSVSHGSYVKKANEIIPFKLTNAQIRVIGEIREDISKPVRMNRLLQGDVGAGKTIVAIYAILEVIEAGGQAVLMAPSDILARQHFKLCLEMFKKIGIRVELLTGRDKGNKRKELLLDLKLGDIKFLIGTHALFQSDVCYDDLRLAVIDEQHKFGVRQRMALAEKGKAVDVLVMTATPIPRSLSLAQYGDMELSILNEKPIGRKPIKTVLISHDRIDDVIQRVRIAIKGNRQIYWICPLIEESEVLNLTAAEDRFQSLCTHFDEDLVGLVHGQQQPLEKDKTMSDFVSGKIKVLVATTVIEVGVDVPNASIMIIEHAERFGLAQLHQLRGRVGRGGEESSCLLLYDRSAGQSGLERLSILRENDDGFVIAESDLKMRGSGDLIGLAQSGLPQFKIADLSIHLNLMQIAYDDARITINNDPNLESERGKAIKNLLYLMKKEESIRLISVG